MEIQNNLRQLSIRAFRAEEELRQMRSRRQEDSKANARVAVIFASHRNAWRDDEKRLLRRIDAAGEEIARLRALVVDSKARVEELEREVVERDEMIGFVSRRFQEEGLGGCGSREHYGAVPLGKKSGEWFRKEEEEEIVGTTNGNQSISKTLRALWIPVIFEGDLAHTAREGEGGLGAMIQKRSGFSTVLGFYFVKEEGLGAMIQKRRRRRR